MLIIARIIYGTFCIFAHLLGNQKKNGFVPSSELRPIYLACVYHLYNLRLNVLRIIFKAVGPTWQLNTIHYSRHTALRGDNVRAEAAASKGEKQVDLKTEGSVGGSRCQKSGSVLLNKCESW